MRGEHDPPHSSRLRRATCLMRVETRIRSPLARDNALAPVTTREKFTGLFAECVAPPRGVRSWQSLPLRGGAAQFCSTAQWAVSCAATGALASADRPHVLYAVEGRHERHSREVRALRRSLPPKEAPAQRVVGGIALKIPQKNGFRFAQRKPNFFPYMTTIFFCRKSSFMSAGKLSSVMSTSISSSRAKVCGMILPILELSSII